MTLDYSQFVRDSLGDSLYDKYFEDLPNNAARSALLLEFLHYNVVLFDKQIKSSVAYGANKTSHVYSLLRHLASDKERDGTFLL